jgi:hypothetical protein
MVAKAEVIIIITALLCMLTIADDVVIITSLASVIGVNEPTINPPL